MASVIMYQCSCGQVFHLYVPKAKLFSKVPGFSLKKAQRDDEEENKNGEIKLAINMAKMVNAQFVDTREHDLMVCQCGQLINWEDIFNQKKNEKKQADDLPF